MLKRAFDLTASLGGLILLSPLMLAVMLAVKLSSAGPIFHRASRVGRMGVPFTLYKFRSMIVNAEQQGPGITASGDKRITRLGKLLRRTKLDELPQLINVLRGEMSIVGPRPEDPRYVALYTPEQRAVLNVRPGITSLASVRYRNEEQALVGGDWEQTYIQKVMPEKLLIDLQYIQNANLWRDLGIIGQTFIALFR